MEALSGVFHIAFAAACMAKGLSVQQTGEVWARMKSNPVPPTPMDAQEDLEQAIAEVVALTAGARFLPWHQDLT